MVTQKNFRYGKTGAGVVSSINVVINVYSELSEKYQCSKSHLQSDHGIMIGKNFMVGLIKFLVAVNKDFTSNDKKFNENVLWNKEKTLLYIFLDLH